MLAALESRHSSVAFSEATCVTCPTQNSPLEGEWCGVLAPVVFAEEKQGQRSVQTGDPLIWRADLSTSLSFFQSSVCRLSCPHPNKGFGDTQAARPGAGCDRHVGHRARNHGFLACSEAQPKRDNVEPNWGRVAGCAGRLSELSE